MWRYAWRADRQQQSYASLNIDQTRHPPSLTSTPSRELRLASWFVFSLEYTLEKNGTKRNQESFAGFPQNLRKSFLDFWQLLWDHLGFYETFLKVSNSFQKWFRVLPFFSSAGGSVFELIYTHSGYRTLSVWQNHMAYINMKTQHT